MATHSNIIDKETQMNEEPLGYSPWGQKELDRTWWLKLNSKEVVKVKWGHQGGVLIQ